MSMTESEAILWVDDRMCYGRYTPQKHNPFIHDECCQAGELAISALEEVQQYRAIGTISEFRELKEKATGKKPEWQEAMMRTFLGSRK